VSLHPQRVSFGGSWHELGPTLFGVDYDDSLPEQRRVYLHWRTGSEAVQVRLWAGRVQVAQGVLAASPGTEPGYVTLALDAPANARELRIEVLSADGARAVPRRGAWGMSRAAPVRLPRPQSRQVYVPLGGKMTLVDARLGAPWQLGRKARVALRFVSQQPIVGDYVVSVGVQGPVLTDAPSDWVPALGAIPTFKWVRGSRVSDVHLIQVALIQVEPIQLETRLPEGAAFPTVEVSVGVYDAFTTAALPPLDERIARLGRAGLELGRVEVRAVADDRAAGKGRWE
jgi:hypothetical protein